MLPHLLDKNNRGSEGNTGLMHSVENTAIFVIVLAPHMRGVLHMTFSLHFVKNLFTSAVLIQQQKQTKKPNNKVSLGSLLFGSIVASV